VAHGDELTGKYETKSSLSSQAQKEVLEMHKAAVAEEKYRAAAHIEWRLNTRASKTSSRIQGDHCKAKPEAATIWTDLG
jgi:hypothetical protein